MNDDLHDFEAELMRMKPAAPPAALRNAIAGALDRRPVAGPWLGFAAAAAWAMIGVALWAMLSPHDTLSPQRGQRAAMSPPTEQTWLSYLQSAGSMQRLEEQLDEEAKHLPRVGGPPPALF